MQWNQRTQHAPVHDLQLPLDLSAYMRQNEDEGWWTPRMQMEKREVEVKLWMASDVALTIDALSVLIEAVEMGSGDTVPLEAFRSFLKTRMPDGFPVKIGTFLFNVNVPCRGAALPNFDGASALWQD